MKFIDLLKIHVQSGNGGPGCTSFRREKFIPFGGPNGGSGGHGGDVIFRGDASFTTLLDLSMAPHQHAGNGGNGMGKDRCGKGGETRIIVVPLGTLVKDPDTDEVLIEVLEERDYLFLKGGRGGRGNASFKTSLNRAPQHHQPGEEGTERWVRLELKLLADVGLVGFPNAGKSTLISSVSKAQPKIADYPFTTLVPHLGVVKMNDFRSFVIADIPGIIERAHEGLGLGHQFLRHIERTSVLVIVLDVSGFAEHPPFEEYKILLQELDLFSDELLKKPRVVVLNKIDAVSDHAELVKLEKKLQKKGETVFCVSAVARQGLVPLLKMLVDLVEKHRQNFNAVAPQE